ncbi:hypothetical protein [Ralstonia sp. 24A2]|uniref:hypothetical protein n=1 Tax=Ralstonia sp. 24A2 TaxID=3447364 RepID=UPI003F69F7FB
MAHPTHDDHDDRRSTDNTADTNRSPSAHPPHVERHVPLRSPTGGTDWAENMRRGRPTNKGKGVPGQRRG